MKKNISITVRAGTEKEEFEYLLYVLERTPFFIKNNYQPVLPDIEELRSIDVLSNKEKYFEIFKKSEYREDFFKAGIKVIKDKEEVIKKCLDRLQKINFNWGFKLFDKYEVILTKYGPGGSYDEHEGKVILLTKNEGDFKRKNPEQTIIHEIIHIGIEKSIIQAFGIKHWEKERLVDIIVFTLFNDILGNYHMQSDKGEDLDAYVTKESLSDLPKAIKEYVSMNPR